MKRLIDRFRGREGDSQTPDELLARVEQLEGSELILAVKRLASEGYAKQMLEKVSLSAVAQKEVVDSLLNSNQAEVVFSHLDLFPDVPRYELGYGLIEHGQAAYVFSHLDQFHDMPVGDAIELAIEGGQIEVVLSQLEALEGYEDWITSTLVKIGDFDTLFAHTDLIDEVGQTDVALAFLGHKKVDELFAHWDQFAQANQHAIVTQLITRSSSVSAVGRYLPQMDQLDPVQVANEMIEAGKAEYVAADLPVFTGVDHVSLARVLIDMGKIDSLGAHLNHFKDLSREIAVALVQNPETVFEVAESFTSFDPGVVTPEFYTSLLDHYAASVIVLNMDAFPMADVDMVVDRFLSEDGALALFVETHHRIPSAVQTKIVKALMEVGTPAELVQVVDELSIEDSLKAAVRSAAE